MCNNLNNMKFSLSFEYNIIVEILENRLQKYNNIVKENSNRIFEITERINNANMFTILNSVYHIMFEERKNLISQNEIYMTKISEIEGILTEIVDKTMDGKNVSI